MLHAYLVWRSDEAWCTYLECMIENCSLVGTNVFLPKKSVKHRLCMECKKHPIVFKNLWQSKTGKEALGGLFLSTLFWGRGQKVGIGWVYIQYWLFE